VIRIGCGHVRLVLGMVAANHPLRLMRNLTSAGAAALGTTAIALMNSSVWLLADHLAPPRMAAALLLSIAIMVGWLIVRYDLWERADDDEEEGILPAGRKRAALFNAATVLTLAAGVIALYALLLAVALASAALVIVDSAFASTLGHGVGAGDYLALAVFATSIGLVGGALGSGFESQDAVRRVAFGVRERHRREEAHAERG
jgi:signal transduction histidine kinase